MSWHFDPNDSWDNLHGPSRPDLHWSTDNVGEAAPGVLTPLSASFWGPLGDKATRNTLIEIGVLPESERAVTHRLEDQIIRIFCGRVAVQVEQMIMVGDRMPGVSGQDMAMALLGTVPDDIEYQPTSRRYPIIAFKLARTFFGMPGRLSREPAEFERFWAASVIQLQEADLAGARRVLGEALRQFEAALQLQSLAVMGHAQVMHEQLNAVIADAGVGDFGVLSGAGGAEMDVISDIWRASRGQLTIDEVVRRHGFHGPLEGEVSSIVWREDRRPLERLIAEYADRDDPRKREADKLARLPAAQAEVLAALPRAKRPTAKLVLNMAAKRIPLRGVAKRSFLQGVDAIRASARRIGSELAAQGVLADADDAFYLTTDELFAVPADAGDLVARRRERRAQYQQVTIPGAWQGQPEPIEISTAPSGGERATQVQGIGVSAGVVEGIARVVTDPSFAEVEPDEILVAPTTDPSWASIMYISAGLVVDMGGPISHAAVVARELDLPCVVNTRTGTRDIRTGDQIRVDGKTGVVEILAPVTT